MASKTNGSKQPGWKQENLSVGNGVIKETPDLRRDSAACGLGRDLVAELAQLRIHRRRYCGRAHQWFGGAHQRLTGVYAEENQFVTAGDLTVELDPRDYQAALNQAQVQLLQAQHETTAQQPNVLETEVMQETNIATSNAAVAGAEASLAAAERNYDAAVAKVREGEATNIKAQTDVERYRPLTEKDEVPREPLNSLTSAAQARTGPAQAMQQAYARIYASVQQQAAVLAYVEVIWIMGAACLGEIVFVFFAKKSKPGQARMGH